MDESRARYKGPLYLHAVRNLFSFGSIYPQSHLCSPDREHPVEVEAPIEYSPLRVDHLPAIHDLLGRLFWDGIEGATTPPFFIEIHTNMEFSSERLVRL